MEELEQDTRSANAAASTTTVSQQEEDLTALPALNLAPHLPQEEEEQQGPAGASEAEEDDFEDEETPSTPLNHHGNNNNRIVLFEGPLFSLDDDSELKDQYVTPIVDMLLAGNLDPNVALEQWTCRITKRVNGVVTDCEYVTDDRETLKTMASIAKHFKVPNTARKQLAARRGEINSAQPRRLSTRVVPVKEDATTTTVAPKKKRSPATVQDSDEETTKSSSNHKKKKHHHHASTQSNNGSRAPSSRRNVRTSFLDIGDEYGSDEAPHASAGSYSATPQLAADSVWGPDKLGLFPSKARQALLNDQLKKMNDLVDELMEIDTSQLFTLNQTRVPGGGPCNLVEVKQKVNAMEYTVGGREAMVYWDKLAEDVENIVKLFSTEAIMNSKTHVPIFLETLRNTCRDTDFELQSMLVKLRTTEERSFLREKNNEPAMPKWRKELMPMYGYVQLDDYVPADALLPEEKTQLLEKLKDSSGKPNRWVYPDGLEMLDLWAQVIALDRSPTNPAPGPNIADAISNDRVVEQHTWGIDCFCRRNIQVSLAKLLTVQQTHYFIEQLLLRALNAVRPIENGWNMRLALYNIIQDHPGEAEPMPPQEPTLKYRRIKVFNNAQDVWLYGRIIDVDSADRQRVLVAYDDLKSAGCAWENLSTCMHQLIGDANLAIVHDSNLPPQLIRACCEILLEHIEKKGERMFAVHSKGVGVVTKVPIDTGKLIQKYTGILYPCWLWEQKEAQEDAERLERKRLTNQIVLPDFWNMRLELPGGDEEGVDLLHVDAKSGGNFSSRMSHSCRPNCGTMTCVVDGKYCIGMRALRPIQAGEELTIDYNCVTDSNDEYLAAVCLCGSHDCRGSFLYTTNATKHVQVSNRSHLPIHRVAMLFTACGEQPGELEKRYGKQATETWPIWISPEERAERKKRKKTGGKQATFHRKKTVEGEEDEQMVIWPLITAVEEEEEGKHNEYVSLALRNHGLGNRALQMLPNWLLRYAAYLVEFIDCEHYEFARLEFHKNENRANCLQDLDERWRICELESNGAAEQRITNLVIALDKARHHMRERLTPQTTTTTITTPLEDRSKLRDIWWVSDRCLSKWVGDDEDEFPEWYGATVTHVYVEKQELRLQYDTHEVNRVPMKLARRPKLEEIPPPHTGCDVSHHQAPFRVLDEDDILFFLWTDGDSGVATRLVKVLCDQLSAPIPLWQSATTVTGTRQNVTKTTYWWNFETREIRLTKPSSKQLEQRCEFVPKVLKQIQRLLLEKTPTTGDGARRCLRELRDLILRIPIPPSSYAIADNMHQKAADLLTLLAMTKNFFVLREPELLAGAAMQHAVINALTSWIGQGVESRVEDITEMIGTALLPCVERAYEHCAGDYRNQIRPMMIDHIRTNGLLRWPKDVRDAFPHSNQLPPQPADIDTQWPHPLPPIRLFGSPSLDAAIYENFDYTRAVALAKEAGATRDLVRLVEKDNKAVQHLNAVAEALNKASQRDWAKMDAEDRERVTAPVLPEEIHFTWVQCEKPECGKWRKLPLGFNEKRLPTPFYCSCLAPDIDEERATCEAPQEEDYLPNASSAMAGGKLDPSALARGDFIDAYDGHEWTVALVLETSGDSVKLRLLNSQQSKVEWRSTLPSTANLAFSSIAQLHTYTAEAELAKCMDLCVPYETLYPEVDMDISHCLHGMVRTLEQNELQDKKKKRKAKRQRSKTQVTMARQVETLAKAQLSVQMDLGQKNAFYSFWAHEKQLDPLQPFMSTVAKWNAMDANQRQTWATTKKSSAAASAAAAATASSALIAPKPKPLAMFPVPSLGKHSSSIQVQMRRVDEAEGDEDDEAFNAEWTGPLVVGMLVDTKYGRGAISAVYDDDTVCVTLAWGKAYFAAGTVRATFPMFSACLEHVSTVDKKKRTSGPAVGNKRKQAKLATATEEDNKPAKPLSAKKKKLLDPFAQMIENRACRWRRRWAHMFH